MIKLIGNAKGVKVLPKGVKELPVSFHKYGANATWSQCTDTFIPQDNAVDAEINAFKYNLQLTALVAPLTDDSYRKQMQEAHATGRIDFGLYFLTWAWENPVTKELTHLPSWRGTVFTQEEADLDIIPQSMVGQTREANYYTIGTRLFELSNGKYGYDDENGIMGEIDVVTGSVIKQLDWFKTVFGYYPTYSSYSYTRRVLDDLLIPRVVATRGAVTYGDPSSYDFGRSEGVYRSMLSTFDADVRNRGISEALTRSEDKLNSVISGGGWFTDFSHWHWAKLSEPLDEWEQFFSQQRTIMSDNNIVTLGFGEAVEYMYLRNMVKRVRLSKSENEYIVIVETKDESEVPLPKSNIRTTLSIELDLIGTDLEGKEINSSHEIQKLSDSKFIVEVPYSKSDGFSAIRLKETNNPKYMDFSLPEITASAFSGDVLSITTDRPTNAVVFAIPSGGRLYEAEVLKRSNKMIKEHNIDIGDTTGKDIYIGVITKEKQSVLSSKL